MNLSYVLSMLGRTLIYTDKEGKRHTVRVTASFDGGSQFHVVGNGISKYVLPSELSEIEEVSEIPARADISPLVARAHAYFNRAIVRDERAAMLTKQHRYEDAENEETIHAAAAYDFLRAFKALEDAMPDVWERLKRGEK